MKIKKLLCWVGLHKDRPVKNNIFHKDKIVFRTYMKCRRCRRWGALIFFKKVDKKAKGTKFFK